MLLYLENYCFQKKISNYKIALNLILDNFVIESSIKVLQVSPLLGGFLNIQNARRNRSYYNKVIHIIILLSSNQYRGNEFLQFCRLCTKCTLARIKFISSNSQSFEILKQCLVISKSTALDCSMYITSQLFWNQFCSYFFLGIQALQGLSRQMTNKKTMCFLF